VGGQGLTFRIGVAEDQQPAAIVILVRFAHVGILQSLVTSRLTVCAKGQAAIIRRPG
jgi:hypothetical protein